jgi:hypothetical protein
MILEKIKDLVDNNLIEKEDTTVMSDLVRKQILKKINASLFNGNNQRLSELILNGLVLEILEERE